MIKPSKLLEHKSVIVLMAANLVPLVFCISGAWKVFDVMFLYWCESAAK